MRHAVVLSTGSHLPETEISNDALRARFAEIAPDFVDRIEPKSGITKRFAAKDDEATSDLATYAARQALARAGVDASEVDMILVGTDSPDFITPSTSVVVQRKLGAVNAGGFDVGCACASFPTALAAASGLIATQKSMRYVLVVGAYMMRRLADPMDPISFLYGDGAGAALVGASESPGILGSVFYADGNLAEDWCIAAGGTREPISKDAIDAGRHQVRMGAKYPPTVNDEGWPRAARLLAEQEGFRLDEVDCFIFTQVRRRTIEKVMNSLELPLDRAHMVMDRFGYTGSACIPMALDDAIEAGRVGPGSLVVMIGSGVGFHQASTALRLTDDLFTPSARKSSARRAS